MNKQIVIINGSGGVGKDTFIDYCRVYAPVYNVSTVDKIKQAAKLLGWDGGKTEKDRKFLSDLKLMSVDYSDHSYNYIKDSVDYFNDPDCNAKIMFIHVREPEEIDRFKTEFGCHTLLITNKNVKEIKTNMADSNVENYTYDFVINNDGVLYELWGKAEQFVANILKSQ